MLEKLVDHCSVRGVRFIAAGVLRLRSDIWERIRSLLRSMGRHDIIHKMERIYFQHVRRSSCYFLADERYSGQVMDFVERSVLKRGIPFGFPFESAPGLEEVSCGSVLSPKKLQASILEYV